MEYHHYLIEIWLFAVIKRSMWNSSTKMENMLVGVRADKLN